LLSLLKFFTLFLTAKLIGCCCYAAPSTAASTLRAAELRLLYKASTQGPSGSEDAVQATILGEPARYTTGVVKLLKQSSRGSYDEKVGLYFAEYVSGDPEVANQLKTVAARQTDDEAKEFIAKLLADPNGKNWRSNQAYGLTVIQSGSAESRISRQPRSP